MHIRLIIEDSNFVLSVTKDGNKMIPLVETGFAQKVVSEIEKLLGEVNEAG